MLQVIDNLRRPLIFSNYIGEIDYFKFDLMKRSDTFKAGPNEKLFVLNNPKEDRNEQEIKP